MTIAPNGQLLMRIESELSKSIFAVHQIVEGKTRKRPRRRQLLKECPVSAVRRIVIAAAPEISHADPWLKFRLVEEVTRFKGYSVGAVFEVSPTSHLNCSPQQRIHFA